MSYFEVYRRGSSFDFTDWDDIMLQKFPVILSKIKSALLNAAVRHPTHFPAVSTALDAKDEPPTDREMVGENGGDPD